eukprot:CAMPEP_0173172370 /NCGR_PEP_ID=MMETSP1141-20130122/2271_1 /TAXON_ID=483371 /ORGANISM="non described non described, Strain CCMP2298" /LENGTH=137 /DNA_ID=CAMNT_0014094399 /DNA_START=185 /DNA_END=598 /DNA_ORIENTATION=+
MPGPSVLQDKPVNVYKPSLEYVQAGEYCVLVQRLNAEGGDVPLVYGFVFRIQFVRFVVPPPSSVCLRLRIDGISPCAEPIELPIEIELELEELESHSLAALSTLSLRYNSKFSFLDASISSSARSSRARTAPSSKCG